MAESSTQVEEPTGLGGKHVLGATALEEARNAAIVGWAGALSFWRESRALIGDDATPEEAWEAFTTWIKSVAGDNPGSILANIPEWLSLGVIEWERDRP